jgi:DNA polymerase III delta prime subunit
MEEHLKNFWTDEFAPRSLDDMVLSEELKNHFRSLIKSKSRFCCLLAGSAGIGKSTLANIITKELDASVLFIPCGIEGNVATAQGKIRNFCESLSMEGKQKIVILDELDSASGTQDNSMQKVLRNIISESQDTMFIGTCNYVEKVIDPIRSRLGVVNLKFSARDLFSRLQFILNEKKIAYTKESLSDFVKNILKTHYPDIRRIISDLQKCCASGILVVPKSISGSSNSFLKDLVEKCSTEKDILNLRQFYITNKSKIEDYLTFSSDLFNYVLDNNLVSNGDAVIRLSNIIYQMNLVIDREIQFFSMMTYLSKVLRK